MPATKSANRTYKRRREGENEWRRFSQSSAWLARHLPQDFSVLVEVDLLEAVGQRLLSILENEVHELVLVGGVGQVGGALGGGTAVRRQETRLH